LNDFSRIFILLGGPVTVEVLLECLADTFNVQIIGQPRNRGNTLSSVTLLDANMDLFFRGPTGIISSVLYIESFDLKRNKENKQMIDR
jgi:hypothetical protein